ncbi:MAG TPA: phasin family protein [Casimicrobiaceae bacterium]|jgi:poly(hydroxyalkanoate) granule-associated protein
MLKKAKAEARADTSSAKDRAQSMLDSSRQIWLAGLGAFARAKGEGRKVFDTLVKQGESLEKETRSAAASTAAAAREAAAEGAARVQTIAGDTWDKLEKVFEDRVAKALARLGVHTQSDVEQLSQRVDALADAVNELIRAQGGKPKARRKASPVKRIVKSTMKSATRTAKGAATSASNAVGGAARTAGKGVRVARKVAKAALGK